MALTESFSPGPHDESVAEGAQAFLEAHNAAQEALAASTTAPPLPDQGYKPDFASVEAAAQKLREQPAQTAEPVVDQPLPPPIAPLVEQVKNTRVDEGVSSLPNPDASPFFADARPEQMAPPVFPAEKVTISGAQKAGEAVAGILQPETAPSTTDPIQEIKADTSIEALTTQPPEVLFKGVRSATEAAVDHAPVAQKPTVYDQDLDDSFPDKPAVDSIAKPQDNARNREFAARINAELGSDFKKQVEFHAARDGIDLEQAKVQAQANEQAEKIARQDAKFIIDGKMNQLNRLIANIDSNTNQPNAEGLEGAIGLMGSELTEANWAEFRDQLGSANHDFYRTNASDGESAWDYRIYETGKPNTVMVEMRDDYATLRGLYAVKTKAAPTKKTLFGRLTRRSEKQVPTKSLLELLFNLKPTR